MKLSFASFKLVHPCIVISSLPRRKFVVRVIPVILLVVHCTPGVVGYTLIPYRHDLVVQLCVQRLLVSRGFPHGISVPLSLHCERSAQVPMCRPKPGPSASILRGIRGDRHGHNCPQLPLLPIRRPDWVVDPFLPT